MSDEYLAHVRRQEMDYVVGYEAWEASLTPAQRGALGGAAAPDLEDHRAMGTRRLVIGGDRDVADSSSASYSVDMSDSVDGPAELVAEHAGISLEQARKVVAWADARVEREASARKAEVIVKLAEVFLRTDNARLSAAGLVYASDLALINGMGTMQDFALANGVSRAAVSKVSRFWRKKLELPTSSHMRDEEKCSVYSEAQKQKAWRKRKWIRKIK